MSVLVVGVSHNSAPVSLLEQVAPQADAVPKLIQSVAACEHVTEATVIAIKEAILRSMCLSRFEQAMRERVRSSLVAASIDRYYDFRATLDHRPPAPHPARHLRVESRGDADASA